MKQNSIFSYLSKIVKSDVKDSNKSETQHTQKSIEPNHPKIEKQEIIQNNGSKKKINEKPKTPKKQSSNSKTKKQER